MNPGRVMDGEVVCIFDFSEAWIDGSYLRFFLRPGEGLFRADVLGLSLCFQPFPLERSAPVRREASELLGALS